MKKQFVVYGLSLIVLLLPIYDIPYTIPKTYAVDSTSSASPSASIKTKLEELKKEIASKAAKLKAEINQKLTNKAYAGTVKSKSESSITIATHNGPKIININQDTEYQTNLKLKKKFTFGSLKEEDYIAALGDVDETQVLTAKKIILLPETSVQKPKTILWGQIASASNSQIGIKDRSLKNHILVTSDKTNFQKGAEEITSDEIKLNNFIIVTGSTNSNGIIAANFIYVIPTGGVLKPKKTATPSAEVSTKSATPKPATSSGKKK